MKTVRNLTTTARAMAKVSSCQDILTIVQLLIGVRMLDGPYAAQRRRLLEVPYCTTDPNLLRRLLEEECVLLEAQEYEELDDAEPVRHGRLR